MSLQIQESLKWQDSPYLPDVTVKLIGVWVLRGLFCQMILAYFFYKSFYAMIWLIPVTVGLTYWQWRNWRRHTLLEMEVGFKEWLFYVKSGLGAGKSIEQAMKACKSEFLKRIGARHPVLLGLDQLYRGMELRVPIEKGLYRFGTETGIKAIKDFAVVFEISHKQGGRMSSVLEDTIRQICEGINLREEVRALIAAKKLEQRIMCVTPFGILFFVGTTSGGFFEPLYHNLQGVCIMSICMGVYIAGVLWGEKMTEVQI